MNRDHARRCLAATMWGHEKMNVLTALSVILLGMIAIWFVWPLIADPIARRRAVLSGRDNRQDDLFRSLAKRAGPDADIFGLDRS